MKKSIMKKTSFILLCMMLMLILFPGCSLNAGNSEQEQTDEEQMVIEKSLVLSGEDGGSITASLTTDGLLYFEEENASGPESEALNLFKNYITDNAIDFNGFYEEYTGVSSLDNNVKEFTEDISQNSGNFDGIRKTMLFPIIGPTIWVSKGVATFPTPASFNAAYSASYRSRYLNQTGYTRRIREAKRVKSLVYCYRNNMIHKVRFKSNNTSSWKAGPLYTMQAGQFVSYSFIWNKTVDPHVKVETYNINDVYPSGFHHAMNW